MTEWRNVNGFERAVTTRRAYDVFHNLIIETKGNGATSQTLFGGYGRQNATIDADGRGITFGYDNFGERATRSPPTPTPTTENRPLTAVTRTSIQSYNPPNVGGRKI